MNVYTCSGNLGRDAEQRQAGEHTVTETSIAVKSGYGNHEKTFWVKAVIWGKFGDSLVNDLKKGARCTFSGELSMDEWTDKEGGKRQTPVLTVRDAVVPFLDQAPDRPPPGRPKQPVPDEDVPF